MGPSASLKGWNIFSAVSIIRSTIAGGGVLSIPNLVAVLLLVASNSVKFSVSFIAIERSLIA